MSPAFPLEQTEPSALDGHFAAFVARFGGDDRLLRLAAAALSRSVREGHICVTLEGIAASCAAPDAPGDAATLPAPAEWRNALRQSPAVGPPDAQTPLVLDSAGRLYLRRYWNYQAQLARAIRDKCSRNPPATALAHATQLDAVAAALRNELTIICGGPGTGKTSTVIQILERLLEQPNGQRLRIALTAPTGKAASRLDESVREATNQRANGEQIRALIPQGAKTIHRLLGRRAGSAGFRHNAENPLPLDFLIVDEASMVALALLSRLFLALPQRCRVLLLGDPDQLASVEPGAVLADVVEAAAAPASPLQGSLITLRKNYRFGDESGIQQACTAVRQGDADRLITLLRTKIHADLVSTEVSTLAELHEVFGAAVPAGFSAVAAEKDPAAALNQLRRFRVLTPLRQGPWGVAGLNRTIAKALAAAGLIPEDAGDTYPGKPILIAQNDYELALYNGDLGLLLPDPAAAAACQLYAWFFGKDNNVRRLAPARLPEHETAYAMTVHKSQGSEFERALFVLPERDNPLLTRELIYTALTRARSILQICWNEAVLRAAVARRAQRQSGLGDFLAPDPQHGVIPGNRRGHPPAKTVSGRREARPNEEVLFLPGFEK
jgi:exodeoxyribonuclease V alpha subunit